MSRTFIDVWKEATDLSEADRAALAGLLIESLAGEPDLEVEVAWAAEIERRVADMGSMSAPTATIGIPLTPLR